MTYQEQLQDPRWEEKKQEVFAHYGGKVCFKCMSLRNIQVHHKHYIAGRMAWEYDVFDLVPLCGDCHSYLHDKVPFTQPYERISSVFRQAIEWMLQKHKSGLHG